MLVFGLYLLHQAAGEYGNVDGEDNGDDAIDAENVEKKER